MWGAAATIAVLHDVLVTLAFLAFFRYEITLNVIAALLTLVGYSVNDTIVIFDRARENLRHKRKDSLRKILNDSSTRRSDPHAHLERHHLPGGARPDCSAARCCAGSASPWRSDPGRNLLDHLHREPVRGLVDEPRGQAAGDERRRPRPPSRAARLFTIRNLRLRLGVQARAGGRCKMNGMERSGSRRRRTRPVPPSPAARSTLFEDLVVSNPPRRRRASSCPAPSPATSSRSRSDPRPHPLARAPPAPRTTSASSSSTRRRPPPPPLTRARR